MDRSDILIKLNHIFSDLFEDEELIINEDMTADDINGWDSLKQVILLNEIEEEFGITFDFSETISMKTVSAIIDAIDKHINNPALFTGR